MTSAVALSDRRTFCYPVTSLTWWRWNDALLDLVLDWPPAATRPHSLTRGGRR